MSLLEYCSILLPQQLGNLFNNKQGLNNVLKRVQTENRAIEVVFRFNIDKAAILHSIHRKLLENYGFL